MPSSLSSRLLLAFAAVICVSLAVSGVGTLWLLRDQQEEAAEERVGGLAEPITIALALLQRQGAIEIGETPEEREARLAEFLDAYAEAFNVRLLLVDDEGLVVADSERALTNKTVGGFHGGGGGSSGVLTADLSVDGEDWRLFMSEPESFLISTGEIADLYRIIINTSPEVFSSEDTAQLFNDLLRSARFDPLVRAPDLRPVIVVPEEQITSTWNDVVPQIAIGGAVALFVGAIVALLIARSITRPLGRITSAAQRMAGGDYDQALDVRRSDEVGRLAQAFNAMARQVSGSHRMMRDLLANVSHELRTPLTSIQGFSQALEEGDLSTPEEYREAGRIINEETQRMRRLVDDLIELSRLEAGEVALERKSFALDELLRACARRFDWRVRDAGAALNVDVPDLPRLVGDERRLEQVFTNLLENAVRHTPSGGTINVSAAAQNGVVRVAVRNTGSYIPPEQLPRVFERFFQLDANRSRRAGGAGLGLAIASEAVQAHRGEITATSDASDGTQFVVVLPVASDGAAKGSRSGRAEA